MLTSCIEDNVFCSGFSFYSIRIHVLKISTGPWNCLRNTFYVFSANWGAAVGQKSFYILSHIWAQINSMSFNLYSVCFLP